MVCNLPEVFLHDFSHLYPPAGAGLEGGAAAVVARPVHREVVEPNPKHTSIFKSYSFLFGYLLILN